MEALLYRTAEDEIPMNQMLYKLYGEVKEWE
jgi:hypothetical protein